MEQKIRIEFIDKDSQVSAVFTDWASAEKHQYSLKALGRKFSSIQGNIRIEHSKQKD
jgi:hypothetical protein